MRMDTRTYIIIGYSANKSMWLVQLNVLSMWDMQCYKYTKSILKTYLYEIGKTK